MNPDCLKASCLAVFISVSTGFPLILSAAEPADEKQTEGQKLTLELCQTCHNYQGTEQAGSIGPPFAGMKSRFPDRDKLFSIINDPQKALNPYTMMPPFGRNQLLSKEEINKVIDFLYTL